MINCDGDDTEKQVHTVVEKLVKRYNVKQKTVTHGNIEITLELRLNDNEGAFVNKVSGLDGVRNAVLISYSGDYVS